MLIKKHKSCNVNMCRPRSQRVQTVLWISLVSFKAHCSVHRVCATEYECSHIPRGGVSLGVTQTEWDRRNSLTGESHFLWYSLSTVLYHFRKSFVSQLWARSCSPSVAHKACRILVSCPLGKSMSWTIWILIFPTLCFSGERCELSSRSGRCAPGVCKNGGTCVNLLVGGFKCECPSGGYEKPYCEMTTRNFPPHSFVTFKGLRQRFHFTLSLT